MINKLNQLSLSKIKNNKSHLFYLNYLTILTGKVKNVFTKIITILIKIGKETQKFKKETGKISQTISTLTTII